MRRAINNLILMFSRTSSASGSTEPDPPTDAPTLQFDDEANSQLLAVLEDF